MSRYLFLLVLSMSSLLACSNDNNPVQAESIPWVRTVVIAPPQQNTIKLSATVKARYEVPVSFQTSGRIISRHVDAGQHVTKGQLLFRLDPRDLQESLTAAEAAVRVAQVSVATAQAELKRSRQLVEQRFISAQALEQYELAEQEALARLNTAQAQQQQAVNALDYAELKAQDSGVLLSVSGEPGQVVTAGQAVAVQALAGAPEAEIFFPQHITPPQHGILQDGQVQLTLTLRQVSGSVDALSRTWQTRYQISGYSTEPALGAVMPVQFAIAQLQADSIEVPVGAIDERGHGAQLWIIDNGKARPVAAEVLSIGDEKARVRADIAAGSQIIALGTHLLTDGQAVRELK